MEKNNNNLPVWQLPVRERVLQGKTDWVHPLAKPHCFIGGTSLCKRYYQVTDYFETDIEIDEIEKRPGIACKECYRKWKKQFNQSH